MEGRSIKLQEGTQEKIFIVLANFSNNSELTVITVNGTVDIIDCKDLFEYL